MTKKTVVDTNPKRIKQIEFSVFSAQDFKKNSVLELYERNLYDINLPNRPPAKFGALDTKMGTGSKNEPCDTCKEPLSECVGHFGFIRLTLPVFHIGYFKHIITILQCICKSCSRVMIPEETRRSYLKRVRNPNLDSLQRKDIQKSLASTCKKVTRCSFCGDLNGTVKKIGALKIIHEKFKKKKTVEEDAFRDSFSVAIEMDSSFKPHVGKAQEDLNPLRVLKLFEKITDEDCEVLGLDCENGRPELFIWTALPVPPVSIRPSIHQETTTNEDDLTVLISEIVEINTKIRTIIQDGIQTSMLMDHWDYLNLQCGMYINSDLSGVPSHLQIDLKKIKKGLVQRLKGKNGRFRGNLSGKRVDFSGRTVISPDPNLSIDQVAVPERIAKVLTYPERVIAHNIEKMRKIIVNGPDVHPGANYIQSSNGIKRFLKYGNRHKIAQELKIGDIVERHLNDDDVILFNRQPSLHKLSIMAHRVKVRPWRTLRFNECVCTPYNADFDGDEMNIHVPQTEEAKAEALSLMGVKNNLVTPRNGEPLVAATQDFITCAYLLSRKDVFIDRAQFSLFCSYMYDAHEHIELPPPTIFKPICLWTGKQVFNILMKPNDRSPVKINLETKCRNFEKPTRQLEGKPIDNSMCENDAWLVIYNSQLLCGAIDKAIIGDGNKKSIFYIALKDYGCDTAANFMNRLAKLSARFMGNRGFSIGIDDVQATPKLSDQTTLSIERGYTYCNDLIEQSRSGKLKNQPGSTQEETLEGHISSVLSKIRDELGASCMKNLKRWNAPLIMSMCGSKGSKINVCQMVACVGQQIINGKRISNGFGDRTLPHFPRYSKTPAAKGFVKNSFYSGLTPPEFFFHAASGREGLVDTAVKTAETGYMQRRLMKALEDLGANYDLSVRNAVGGVVQFCYGDDGLDPALMEGDQLPLDMNRNFMHCQAISLDLSKKESIMLPWEIRKFVTHECESKSNVSLTSKSFLDSVSEFIEKSITTKIIESRIAHGLDEGTKDGQKHKKEIQLKTFIKKTQLKTFFKTCIDKYARARVEPGSAVGALGAQSIGEPGTQMTLKTFHFAGVASMNVTLGVPRIKEIINASKVISTPIIDAPLSQDLLQNPLKSMAVANIIKGRIEKTYLSSIVKYMQELVSPGDCFLKIKVDIQTITKMQLEISLDTIKQSLMKAPRIKINETDIWVDHPDVIRIKIPPIYKNGDDSGMFYTLQALKRALPKVVVKGISTINRVVVSEESGNPHLLVEGYGLIDVMGIPGIDGTRCKTNHTLEMQKTLGIETARSMIINEIMYIMEKHGMTIDRRHVMLLADLMTFKGEILGITRNGIAKMRDSVLMLASFEKTTDHLFDASFYGKKDEIEGVSECIIMGVPMSIGTGMFKLIQKATVEDDIPKPKNDFLIN